MKKIFCLLLFVVSSTAVMAQSKNQQEEKPALEQRVDSLQHELAFLKAEYELGDLCSDNIINLDINNVIKYYCYEEDFLLTFVCCFIYRCHGAV